MSSAALDVITARSGRDLVLLHSLLSDRGAFDRVRPELEKSFRLQLVSLPGYGKSVSRNESSIEDYADRLAAQLDFSSETAVLGNGFGGFIALSLAIRHGAKLAALIAAPALAGFPAPAKEPFRIMAGKVREGGMATVLEAAIQRMFPPAFVAAHPDIVAERKSALAKADPERFARACLALSQLDFSSSLKGIKLKTLVLTGELDQTTPSALARELAAGIPGATFHEIPGCGHCPQIERPADFVFAVRRFLK